MSTFDGAFELSDDDEVELLEVRQRRTNESLMEPDHSDTPSESQTESTQSRKNLFWRHIEHFRSKTFSQNATNQETEATSELAPGEEIMTDPAANITGTEDYVKLPSLPRILPEVDHIPEPEGNIDRPYFNKWAHCEGFVAWWDNRTGKGMIINHRYGLEHKIELLDIKWSNYGALIPGSMVEYEYSEDGYNKGFSKFWVVSGCEYVLWKDAWANEEKYKYMENVKRECYERGG